jgi:hypothetical protein
MTAECSGGIERLRGEPIIYSEGLYSIELNLGLSEWEVQDAFHILRIIKGNGPFFGFAGNMLVSGPPRSGKDLFMAVMGWKGKRYFKGKKVLRDEHPTKLFGEYTFFNEDTLVSDVTRMSDVAEDDDDRKKKKLSRADFARTIGEWCAESGEVLLQNSIVCKGEFWKDVDCRRPMSPMTLAFSGFMKMFGHLDMLLMGSVQDVDDLDRKRILPWVALHAKCTWWTDIPNTTRVSIYHVKWSKSKQQLITLHRPFNIFLDGGRPRSELGGARYYDLFKSKSAPNMKSMFKL